MKPETTLTKDLEQASWRRPWREFRIRARQAGFNRIWVFARAWCDARLPGFAAAALAPSYQNLVLICGGGRQLWRRYCEASARDWDASENPLDHYTVSVLESLVAPLRAQDASLVTAYPFRHARQIVGLQSLLEGTSLGRPAPFGLGQDPRFGPWWAMRGLLLTALPLPLSTLPVLSACQTCKDTPCVTACPGGAVHLEGFQWRECAQHRLNALTCREDCPARMACPVGFSFHYHLAQMRHHYRASMREVRAHLAPHPPVASLRNSRPGETP